jgi:hypothetical protein
VVRWILLTTGVLCSGSLAASAGVAKLIGLAVSSRTRPDHSSV